MYATDFIYDSLRLSDFGFMIADIGGSSGITNIDAGAPITFTTVSRNGGKHFTLTNVIYESALEITFSICKNTCKSTDVIINDWEYLELMRWLYRRNFLELCFIDDDQVIPRHYIGGLNVTKIEMDGELVGLELKLTTDKPYAYGDTIRAECSLAKNTEWDLVDTSMIVGEVSPKITVTCKGSGLLKITNSFNSNTMAISNCVVGETITIDCESCVITSSDASHDLWNDFNYVFLKIGNIYSDRHNIIKSNMDCIITIEYSPVIVDTL